MNVYRLIYVANCWLIVMLKRQGMKSETLMKIDAWVIGTRKTALSLPFKW